ncbi:MAG: DoxX family protein [Paludibacter sp.]|nr:DoxX family protein [Paludibacter sp.]
MYRRRNNLVADNNGWVKARPIIMLISRLIIAIVFIFSGFVKAIDPLGGTYKIDDYLTAFGGIFTSLTPVAFVTAVLQSTLELVIGLNLLFRIHLRSTTYIALAFMIIMLPLTLYIALKNPVSDCGCFGDALIISNWQTFYKNIVITILIILLLITSTKHKPILLPNIEWIITGIFVLTGFGLSYYSYNHLPIIDFRPYKIGTNISEAMYVPDDAPMDKYETTFIYEKDGVQKEFTLENYPKNDSTWKFVDQKTTLISTGYKAPIHDFSIVTEGYDDITDEVIHYEGKSYLLVMYDLDKTSEKGAKKAEAIYQKYKDTNTRFYALTASSDETISKFKEKTGVTFPFCKTDPITLKTIVRSNPGLVLIENGVITGKWHWHDFN